MVQQFYSHTIQCCSEGLVVARLLGHNIFWGGEGKFWPKRIGSILSTQKNVRNAGRVPAVLPRIAAS